MVDIFTLSMAKILALIASQSKGGADCMRILTVFLMISMVALTMYKAINTVTKGSTQTTPHNFMRSPGPEP